MFDIPTPTWNEEIGKKKRGGGGKRGEKKGEKIFI